MPARKQNRNIGSVPDAASKATKIGSGVRLVISQAAPVDAIQPPVLESRLAIQRARKARLASGAKAVGWLTLVASQGLLVESMGLVVHPADRADDVVGRLVVLED